MSLLRSDHPWSRASESADHPRRVCHRPWTSSFSVRSLLARPSPARPRPVPACRRPPPRAVGAPVVEFFPDSSSEKDSAEDSVPRTCGRVWTDNAEDRRGMWLQRAVRSTAAVKASQSPADVVVVEFFPRGSLVSGPSSSSSGFGATLTTHRGQQSGRNVLSTFGATLIERYIYSLPDYRLHERHRRNFIEIHSFNGLLATRKVIGMPRQISPSFGTGADVGPPETKKLFSTKFRNVSAPLYRAYPLRDCYDIFIDCGVLHVGSGVKIWGESLKGLNKFEIGDCPNFRPLHAPVVRDNDG